MRLPTPGSYWIASAPAPDRSHRALPSEADVVVIGAGIAGLTTAYLLSQRDRDVVVVESAQVASGVSGHSTAKVTAQHDLVYERLLTGHGLHAATLYGRAQSEALEWIAAEVERLDVACGFRRRDSVLYTRSPRRRQELAREAGAAQEAGLPAMYEDHADDLPFPVEGAVRFADQAQFHPRQWLLALADGIERHGGRIFEDARVVGISDQQVLKVRTVRGDIRAREVVVATHYPVLDRGLFFARLEPVRNLAVSGQVTKERAPQTTSLSVDDHHSLRTHVDARTGRTRLIVVGEPYRTGERIDVEAGYQRLARWSRQWFGVRTITHRWSAHDLVTPDRLPYVGRYHIGATHLWVATGFGQWGMTNGTAAGHLLAGLLTDTAAKDLERLLDPCRVGVRAAPRTLRANAVVAKHLGVEHARALLDPTHPSDLDPGTSTVTRVGAKLVAAYREDTGELHCVSARCTHLGCIVTFNNAERSWDCPCHASRFGLDGEVLHGPAMHPLPAVSIGGVEQTGGDATSA